MENWWTGKKPEGVVHSAAQLKFTNITRQDILNYFDNGWTLTEVLFSGLAEEEAFVKAPIHGLRHPLIFYYGHPAVLYVNKLRVAKLLPGPVNKYFENILEVGVDEMSWDDMSKNEMKWPSMAEVREYRQTVYNLIKDLILNDPRLDPEKTPITQDTPAWALVMGFEHERIHLETSSVLMRELPLKYLKRPQHWPASDFKNPTAPASPTKLLKFPDQRVKIGKPQDYPSFGWDNEYGLREVNVDAFEVQDHPTTNKEYLEFVNDGGYREERFWSAEGWKWRSFKNTKAPTFWLPEGPGGLHQYRLRTIFEVIEFQNDWPVIVNFHEAKAFCKWKTEKENSAVPFRLISEAEHHCLRKNVQNDVANSNLKSGSESSVFLHKSGDLYDVFGNVWQWCEDEFNPLPGFKVHPYYEDFSSPCFDGRHHMMMGGSFVSTGDEAEPFARFHFRPHFFQHAGFRIARSAEVTAKDSATRLSKQSSTTKSDYESSELLMQYLLLHFGTHADIFPFENAPKEALDFPQRCADMVIKHAKKLNLPMNSALDIGCAVGGSSFKLSEEYHKVVGVDLSSSFIRTANAAKNGEALEFRRKDQGDIRTSITVRKPGSANPDRIEFAEGDACNLPENLKNFDAVLMANLLCRLPDPRACLRAMAGDRSVVAPGGLLVLVSPYSWLPEHTDRSSWLGGKYAGDQALYSDAEITQLLSPSFTLLEQANMPLIIREHERKYQYIVSHLMVWQRKK